MADPRITVDTTPLVRHAAEVEAGAVRDFVDGATTVLGEIQAGAVARWPVATGRSRDAFSTRSAVGQKRVSVAVLNAEKYAFKIRLSQWTAAQLDAQVAKVDAIAGDIERFVARGRTTAAQAAIRTWATGKLAHAQARPGETPAEAVRRRLTALHGRGAPSPAVAGKNPWNIYVYRPAKAAEGPFAETLRAQLVVLARRAAAT